MKKKPNTNTATAHAIISGGFVLVATFHGPTNCRGSRITVTREDTKRDGKKQSVTVSWEHANENTENYDKAVLAWIEKFKMTEATDHSPSRNWLADCKFVRGFTPTGHTYTAIWND